MHFVQIVGMFMALAMSSSLTQAQVRALPPILIGQTAILDAPNASLSREPMVGVKAFLSRVNAAGGVNGRQIELVVADDKYDAEKAAENVKRFVDAGAVALLMPIGTVPSVAAVKAATELKIPLVGPYSGAPGASKSSEFLFPTRINFAEEYGRIVNHLLTLGVTSIGFAYADNAGGKYSEEVTRKIIEQRGYKMVKSVSIKLDGSDAKERANELAAARPAAIVLSLDNKSASTFVKSYRATKTPTSFYSFSFLDGKALFGSIGNDAVSIVVSQVVPYPWGKHLPILNEYREAMQSMGASDLSYGSLEGYINAKILIEGMRRAGSSITRESVRRGLESMGQVDLGGVFARYGPQAHLNTGFSELTQIGKDGLYIR